MKNFLRKLHISSQSEDSEGSKSSAKIKRLSDVLSSERNSNSRSDDNKPFSAISGWLNSVTNRQSPSPPSSSNVSRGNIRMEPSDSASSSGLEAALDAVRRDSESSNSRGPDIEEEYQIQLALELSAREDPEAVQIEAVKQISLGSCAPENTAAEIVAYRFWVSLFHLVVWLIFNCFSLACFPFGINKHLGVAIWKIMFFWDLILPKIGIEQVSEFLDSVNTLA